jgi:hypothetical protein
MRTEHLQRRLEPVSGAALLSGPEPGNSTNGCARLAFVRINRSNPPAAVTY